MKVKVVKGLMEEDVFQFPRGLTYVSEIISTLSYLAELSIP